MGQIGSEASGGGGGGGGGESDTYTAAAAHSDISSANPKPPTPNVPHQRIVLPSAISGGAGGGGWVKWSEEIDEYALWDVVKLRVKERERLKKGGKKQVLGFVWI
jgi:hypothetical protein